MSDRVDNLVNMLDGYVSDQQTQSINFTDLSYSDSNNWKTLINIFKDIFPNSRP